MLVATTFGTNIQHTVQHSEPTETRRQYDVFLHEGNNTYFMIEGAVG